MAKRRARRPCERCAVARWKRQKHPHRQSGGLPNGRGRRRCIASSADRVGPVPCRPAAPALRRALTEILTPPDMTTPPTRIAIDGAAAALDSTDVRLPEAAPPSLAGRTARPASATEPAPRKRAPSKGSNSSEVLAWLDLRERVKAEQARRGLDRAGLATVLGLSATTVHKALSHRTPPSVPIATKLRAFLADLPDTAPGRPQEAAQALPGPEDGTDPETPPAASLGGCEAPAPDLHQLGRSDRRRAERTGRRVARPACAASGDGAAGGVGGGGVAPANLLCELPR